jgi:peptidoglycan-associated lipoprotein
MGVFLIAGCGGDNRVAQIEPETMPDRMSTNDGYDFERAPGSEYNSEDEYYYEDAEKQVNLITIHFDYDDYNLTPEAMDLMSSNADKLMKNPTIYIRVDGHCDERGTEEYNLALGEKRARAVKDYLVKYGIEPKRISVLSFGESIPFEYGQNEKAWAKNRRAEFAVIAE